MIICFNRTFRLALVICLMSGCFTATADDEKPVLRTITVNGLGKIPMPPNVADVNVGVSSHAGTAQAAFLANNECMAALMNVLRERGIASKDIQTSMISIQPQYAQQYEQQPIRPPGPQSPLKIVGYQVQNTVRITAHDLKKLGPLLDAIVGAGANQVSGISFRIDNPETLLNEVRKEAIVDAARTAKLLADAAGMVLGAPVSIRDETGTPSSPVPLPVGPYAMAAPSTNMPISPGEQELRVTVQVVYELKAAK
jgi:uncharacterized protein